MLQDLTTDIFQTEILRGFVSPKIEFKCKIEDLYIVISYSKDDQRDQCDMFYILSDESSPWLTNRAYNNKI